MKYAIVESGGKQYRAVEGETIAVDRLPVKAGDEMSLDRILMLVDGDQYNVGAPTLKGFEVRAKVMEHFKGPKVLAFRYSPKKRIRVRRGSRHQFTRLMIEHVGKPGGKPAKVEKPAEVREEAAAEAEKKPAAPKSKSEKAPAKKAAAGSASKAAKKK
ncbi:MAG: 50S ribosomal protein L21 [Chloroflexota bacterium]